MQLSSFAGRRQRQSGLSLVEMMVGITVGLFVVAAASMLVSMQLNDNRRLLLETQVQQDLRASLDIITRELRRAGFWSQAEMGVWSPTTGAAQRNIYVGASPTGGNAGVTFNYRRLDGAVGPYGYDLSGGAIRTLLAGAGWQDLTDKNVLNIESLQVVADNSAVVRLQCPKVCPSPPPLGQPVNYCWPTIGVRSFIVTITGSAVSDATVRRTVQSRVRLRNDALIFNAGDVADPQACPA
jgi:type IV pilus assembly protein PilW